MSKKLVVLCLYVLGLPAAHGQDHATADAHHQQAMALYRARDGEGAVRELKKAVEADEHYAEAWNDLGVIQRQRGELKPAIDSFRKAVTEKAIFVNAVYNLALALEAAGDRTGASEQIRHVIALAPRLPQGHALYARLLADTNQLGRAREEFRQALDLDSNLSQARTGLGAVLIKLGLITEALAELRQAVAHDSGSAQAHFQLGLALFQSGAQQEAKAEFENAVRIEPDLAEARINLGELEENEDRIADAIENYRAAARASSTADAPLRLARALIHTQALQEAKSTLETAIRRHPRNAALHVEMGKLLNNLGERKEALGELTIATEINPKEASSFFELSRVLHDLGRLDQQKAALETAIRLDPNAVEVRYALANLARQTGDTAASSSQLAKVQEIRQQQVDRDLALGEIRAGVVLAGKHEYDAAIEKFRHAIAINVQLGEAHFNLAGALLEKGDTDAAIQSFHKAIEIAPQWAEAHYQLGRALLQAGRREEAANEFHAALKYEPGHAGARLALR